MSNQKNGTVGSVVFAPTAKEVHVISDWQNDTHGVYESKDDAIAYVADFVNLSEEFVRDNWKYKDFPFSNKETLYVETIDITPKKKK